jgi:hypothetical protein
MIPAIAFATLCAALAVWLLVDLAQTLYAEHVSDSVDASGRIIGDVSHPLDEDLDAFH